MEEGIESVSGAVGRCHEKMAAQARQKKSPTTVVTGTFRLDTVGAYSRKETGKVAVLESASPSRRRQHIGHSM